MADTLLPQCRKPSCEQSLFFSQFSPVDLETAEPCLASNSTIQDSFPLLGCFGILLRYLNVKSGCSSCGESTEGGCNYLSVCMYVSNFSKSLQYENQHRGIIVQVCTGNGDLFHEL